MPLPDLQETFDKATEKFFTKLEAQEEKAKEAGSSAAGEENGVVGIAAQLRV